MNLLEKLHVRLVELTSIDFLADKVLVDLVKKSFCASDFLRFLIFKCLYKLLRKPFHLFLFFNLVLIKDRLKTGNHVLMVTIRGLN